MHRLTTCRRCGADTISKLGQKHGNEVWADVKRLHKFECCKGGWTQGGAKSESRANP